MDTVVDYSRHSTGSFEWDLMNFIFERLLNNRMKLWVLEIYVHIWCEFQFIVVYDQRAQTTLFFSRDDKI